MGAVTEESIKEIAEEDFLRAQFYAFLSQLLAKPPSVETLEAARQLDGDNSPMGDALTALAKIAKSITHEDLEGEYSKLFYGMGQGGEILPYGCYYLTGLLYDLPLAKLREDMSGLGVEHSGENSEPEDHIAYLFEVMHGLILGRFGDDSDLTDQRDFFEEHIEPWAPKLFTDLEAAESSVFYAAVARVGRLFVGIESDAFKMAV